jgi:hypothetical protein
MWYSLGGYGYLVSFIIEEVGLRLVWHLESFGKALHKADLDFCSLSLSPLKKGATMFLLFSIQRCSQGSMHAGNRSWIAGTDLSGSAIWRENSDPQTSDPNTWIIITQQQFSDKLRCDCILYANEGMRHRGKSISSRYCLVYW